MVSTSFEHLKLVIDPPVATIALHRPSRRNALNQDLIQEIRDAIDHVATLGEVAGVIITGSNEVFSAGADLNETLQINTEGEFLAYNKHWQRTTDAIEQLPKPVVAAICGYCFTGGLELAMACDLRMAADNASFAITSAQIGSVPGFGGTQRLPRLVGVGNAKRLLFAADPIDAQEAFRIGLVEWVVPLAEIQDAVRALIIRYAALGPISLASIKAAVNQGINVSLDDSLSIEAKLAAHAFTTEDKREGMAAFLEKRTASFRGR